MLLIDLICLQVIMVYIIDLSGVTNSLKMLISSLLTKGKIKSTNFSLKPFTCSLCMTWWAGLFYLFYTHQFSLPTLLLVSMLSYLTTPTKDLLLNIRDRLIKYANRDIDKK